MFYPCVVKDKKGKVKRKYSTKQLNRRHWKYFRWNYKLNPGTDNKAKPPVFLDGYKDDEDPNFYLP